MLGPTSGAAGSALRPLVLTNIGGRPCELRDFRGVFYVAGDDGHQVGPAAQETGARGAQVAIPPGSSAAAELQLVQVRNFDPPVCRTTLARGLRMYPPSDTAALFVPAAGTGRAGTPPGPQLTSTRSARRDSRTIRNQEGMRMHEDEDEMLVAIQQMVDAEHELRRGLAHGSVQDADARERLGELAVSLDQCRDLLRQRRAKVEFHQDPDQARLRPADVVEHYWS